MEDKKPTNTVLAIQDLNITIRILSKEEESNNGKVDN